MLHINIAKQKALTQPDTSLLDLCPIPKLLGKRQIYSFGVRKEQIVFPYHETNIKIFIKKEPLIKLKMALR